MPTQKQIAEHWGDPFPVCQICARRTVERCHIVPHARGGSYELDNLVLLCSRHHREMPDTPDVEAFYRWLAVTQASWMTTQMRRAKELQDILRDVYGWGPTHFTRIDSVDKFKEHFSLGMNIAYAECVGHPGFAPLKLQTLAWALDQAYRRLGYARSA